MKRSLKCLRKTTCYETYGCKTYGCEYYGCEYYGCMVTGCIVTRPMVARPMVVSPMVIRPMVVRHMVVRPIVLRPMVVRPMVVWLMVVWLMVVRPMVVRPMVIWPMVVRPMVIWPMVVRPLDAWPMFATKAEVYLVSLPYFFYTFPKPPVFDTLENRMITLHLIFGWTIINIQANYQSSREWITPESILEHKNVKIVKDVKIDGCSVKLSCNMHLHMSFVSIRLGTISGWKQDCSIFLASFVILKRSEYFVFYMLNLCD